MDSNLDQSVTARRSGQNRPTEEHEAMARALLGAMQKMMQESQTTTGEVVGDDGGKVRVRFADSDTNREVGFPRQRGQRFAKGDIVPLHRLRGGSWFLGGSLSTKEGLDPAVANEDLHTDAVDGRALKGGSITRTHLTGKVVGENELDDSAVTSNKIKDGEVIGSKLAPSAVDTGNIKNNSVTGVKLANSYAPDNHDHDQDYQEKGNYLEQSDLADYAKNTDVFSESKIKGWIADAIDLHVQRKHKGTDG